MFFWPRPVGLHAAGSNPTGIDPSAGLLAIASKLACRAPDGGHRTLSGRPLSFKSVLTILKNRVYLGEVGWRGEWHEGAHEALVDPAVLDKAQGLLYERGEDAAKRATHGSDYLLTGLVVCACGARFTGTAATGRHRTYRYYTCGACQRWRARGHRSRAVRGRGGDRALPHELRAREPPRGGLRATGARSR